jgi:fatty acid desaturase
MIRTGKIGSFVELTNEANDASQPNIKETIMSYQANHMGSSGAGVSRTAKPVKLSKAELTALSRLNPLISTCHILLEWGLMVIAAVLCRHFWHLALYVLTVAFIGARQHALLILMHDGTHYRLYNNRKINDWVTELLLAWPHLVSMQAYRQNHIAHHSYVNTINDPDWMRKQDNPEWQFPQSALSLLRIFIRDISGLGAINLFRLASSMSAAQRTTQRAYARIRLAYYVAAIVAIVVLGSAKTVLLYWLVPYFTWLIVIMRLRSIAEHFAIDSELGYGRTRTTQAGLLAKVFIAPKNVNFHIEHHSFPSVPFFRLPRLHAALMAKEGFSRAAHITNSYSGVIAECLERRAGKRSEEPYQMLARAER